MFEKLALALMAFSFTLVTGCIREVSETEARSKEAPFNLNSQIDVDKLNSMVGQRVSIVGELHPGKGSVRVRGKYMHAVTIEPVENKSFQASDFGSVVTVTGVLGMTPAPSISDPDADFVNFAQTDGGGRLFIIQPTWEINKEKTAGSKKSSE